jgi:hypothetical protein
MKKLFLLFLITNMTAATLTGQVMMMFSSDPASGITSPLDLDSLFYWYAADVGVTDSVGSPIANNSGVETWTNLSPRGANLKKRAANNRPIWQATGGPGSRPAVVFTSTNTSLAEQDSTYWNSDNITVFVVGKVANATANQEDIYCGRDFIAGASQFTCFGSVSAQSFRESMWTSANGSTIQTDRWTPKSASFRVLTFRMETATNVSNLFINGSDQTRNTNATQTGIYDGYNKFFCGFNDVTISEMIVYSRALTTGERTAIENYLNKKYDLF